MFKGEKNGEGHRHRIRKEGWDKNLHPEGGEEGEHPIQYFTGKKKEERKERHRSSELWNPFRRYSQFLNDSPGKRIPHAATILRAKKLATSAPYRHHHTLRPDEK